MVPVVIEPTFGVDRALFTLLLDAYLEKKDKDETKTILQLSPILAPVKAAVFPLVKKEGLAEKARQVHQTLVQHVQGLVLYDEDGSIGRRYARVDEIGCPYAITIDFQTKEDDTVTVRERDSGAQTRVLIKELPHHLTTRL